jgi:hypothetical protein
LKFPFKIFALRPEKQTGDKEAGDEAEGALGLFPCPDKEKTR